MEELLFDKAKNGNIDVVRDCLDRGIAANISGWKGLTPLHQAASNGHIDIMKLLLKRGANINKKNKIGWTPLHVAVDEKQEKAVNLLLYKRADTEVQTENGHTALHWAVTRGNVPIVYSLLKRGACSNVRDKIGFTPLHRACATDIEQCGIVQILLCNDADVTIVSEKGETAMDIAQKFKHFDIVKLLREKQIKGDDEKRKKHSEKENDQAEVSDVKTDKASSVIRAQCPVPNPKDEMSTSKRNQADDKLMNIIKKVLSTGVSKEQVMILLDLQHRKSGTNSFADENDFCDAVFNLDIEEKKNKRKFRRCERCCTDKDDMVLFMPCGQILCCTECAIKLKGEGTCPVCRKPIDNFLKTYLL